MRESQLKFQNLNCKSCKNYLPGGIKKNVKVYSKTVIIHSEAVSEAYLFAFYHVEHVVEPVDGKETDMIWAV